MTLDDLSRMLKSTGFPVTYRAWPENAAPPLPFICYVESYSNNFSADGEVYVKGSHIQIELYTALKDPAAEENLERALAGIVWEKTETYLSTEKCFQIMYEIEV